MCSKLLAWLMGLLVERPCQQCQEFENDLIKVRSRVATVFAECEMAEQRTVWPFHAVIPTKKIRMLLGAGL